MRAFCFLTFTNPKKHERRYMVMACLLLGALVGMLAYLAWAAPAYARRARRAYEPGAHTLGEPSSAPSYALRTRRAAARANVRRTVPRPLPARYGQAWILP